MKRLAVFFFALATVAAHAAGAGDERYLPDIRGRLRGVSAYPPTNVCLRHSGSEATQCAYTDMEGRFYIPSFGSVRSRAETEGDDTPGGYPEFWLELGTRTGVVTRLHSVRLGDRRAELHLECNLERTADPCEAKNPG
ncbi:hypothetical protein [Dokdonella fugitiva]|uniref:Uncharacterized protein n=1 Tax=Dokdonella fugitiva TaxID=328517 RepID=A0A4R2I496_9GAMM|nr:hypothetical protein [Dokdonella fugitiva]TCO38934.1 hypothetical protein EV148_107222 [Dokdonella fugitiva]